MSEKAIIAEAKIEKECTRVGATEAGIKYIKTVNDPFNDEEIDCEGYPDKFSGKNIVQRIPVGYDIKAPPSAAGGNWDCNIFFDSLLSLHYVMDTGFNHNSFAAVGQGIPASGVQERGGVEVRSAAAGTLLTDDNIDIFSSVNTTIDSRYLIDGGTRVIGMGFEVINTTAEINKQGTVTVWRDNDNGQSEDLICNLAADVGTPSANRGAAYPMILAPHVPNSASAAMRLYGSKQWKASEGCYVVATQKNDSMKFRKNIRGRTLIPMGNEKGYRQWDCPSLAANYTRFSTAATDNTAITWFPMNGLGGTLLARPTLDHDFNTSGAFFTGLSNATTLKLVVHYIIERCPNEDNLDLVVLTRRAAAFDPIALELNAKTQGFLPAGTMRKNNDAGDWVKEVADVLQTFGVPGMPIVKGIVTGAQKLYGAYNGNSSQQGQAGMARANNQLAVAIRTEANALRKFSPPLLPPRPRQRNTNQNNNQGSKKGKPKPRPPKKSQGGFSK